MSKTVNQFLIGLAAACFTISVQADDEVQPVHWAFSSFFGTGWYQVEDNRSVFVVRIPPRQTIRQSSYENGQRKLGIEIHYPLTLGLHNLDFDDIPGIISPDNFGTVSFTPGVEVEIPVNESWALRPFIKVGWGKEFELDQSAWIYETGIKSRYEFSSKHVEWAFLGNIQFAGFNPSDGQRDDISSVLLGLEARQPLARAFWGQEYDLHWHATFTKLDRELQFANGDGSFTNIEDIFEVGLAFSFRDRPFRFWFWKPARLGLGIKFSPDGDFQAITFTTRSWFTK